MKNQFDTLSFIMDFESGALSEEQIIEGFQHLIDAGIVWQLQGSYGRMATQLINAGRCYPKGWRSNASEVPIKK
jgi:hypothetical protein